MEKLLKDLFDFQRFSPNAELEKMSSAAEERLPASDAISDEDIRLVNAAGEPDILHEQIRGKSDDE